MPEEDKRLFELLASFGSRAPYRILADGGIVLNLELTEDALQAVTRLYQSGKGKELRVLIEVREPKQYRSDIPVLKGQTKWIDEETM